MIQLSPRLVTKLLLHSAVEHTSAFNVSHRRHQCLFEDAIRRILWRRELAEVTVVGRKIMDMLPRDLLREIRHNFRQVVANQLTEDSRCLLHNEHPCCGNTFPERPQADVPTNMAKCQVDFLVERLMMLPKHDLLGPHCFHGSSDLPGLTGNLGAIL